jgi:hypothetical protein
MARASRSLRARLADARERHRPTGFGFGLADSIEYLDAATWGTLTADRSVFLQRRYLRALERACPDTLNLLIRTLLRAVPHGEAPDRNPFKNAPVPET